MNLTKILMAGVTIFEHLRQGGTQPTNAPTPYKAEATAHEFVHALIDEQPQILNEVAHAPQEERNEVLFGWAKAYGERADTKFTNIGSAMSSIQTPLTKMIKLVQKEGFESLKPFADTLRKESGESTKIYVDLAEKTVTRMGLDKSNVETQKVSEKYRKALFDNIKTAKNANELFETVFQKSVKDMVSGDNLSEAYEVAKLLSDTLEKSSTAYDKELDVLQKQLTGIKAMRDKAPDEAKRKSFADTAQRLEEAIEKLQTTKGRQVKNLANLSSIVGSKLQQESDTKAHSALQAVLSEHMNEGQNVFLRTLKADIDQYCVEAGETPEAEPRTEAEQRQEGAATSMETVNREQGMVPREDDEAPRKPRRPSNSQEHRF